MTPTAAASGSAHRHGPLWGARARDWAEIEEAQAPVYEEGLRRTGVGRDQRVLDVGCGSGVYLRMAADRGAAVSGLDAAEALIELARERVPEADLRVGDMQFMPFEDDSFDVVTGFNSFFFAADMTAALREAGRVAKRGGRVLVGVWGRPERCDLTPMLEAVRSLRAEPAAASAAAGPPAFHEPGVLERIASDAGLAPELAYDVVTAMELPDEGTLVRRMLAPGGVIEAIQASGEAEVAQAIVESLAPKRRDDGSYLLENEWHALVARA
jgi:SAM-dependent methyltransferase